MLGQPDPHGPMGRQFLIGTGAQGKSEQKTYGGQEHGKSPYKRLPTHNSVIPPLRVKTENSYLYSTTWTGEAQMKFYAIGSKVFDEK